MATMFLVIGPQCWGKGDTQKKAYRNARKESRGFEGKRMPFLAYRYDTDKSPEVSVNPIWGNMQWRGEKPLAVDAWGLAPEAMAEVERLKETA
jgi:hypothetical protein